MELIYIKKNYHFFVLQEDEIERSFRDRKAGGKIH